MYNHSSSGPFSAKSSSFNFSRGRNVNPLQLPLSYLLLFLNPLSVILLTDIPFLLITLGTYSSS